MCRTLVIWGLAVLQDRYDVTCLEGVERRRGQERRRYSLMTLARSLFGRRALGRRVDDQVGAYLDRFGPETLLLSLIIITLCSADAVFTVNLINNGAYELNPLMRWTMEQCVYFFLSLKLSLTLIGLFILLGLKNFYAFNRVRVSYILYGVLVSYVLLMKYHYFLHTV